MWTEPDTLIAGLGALLLGVLLGGLVVGLVGARRRSRLEAEVAVLETRIGQLTQTSEEREEMLDQVSDRLAHTFDALADRSLTANSETFLRLAREHLGSHQTAASAELAARSAAVERLVEPIGKALDATREQVARLERDRLGAFGNIERHLETMAREGQALRTETGNLVKALRRPEVRGRWGELTLKRLVELAGLVDRCDFYEQTTATDGERAVRPDMVIRLPEQRTLVVDVKTPLDAYLEAMEATTEQATDAALARHARIVRERVRELGAKAYWSSFSTSPEFVVLFVPGEQFLAAALDRDPSLFEDALSRKVIPATPASLIALLKTVAYGWRQIALAENAGRIRDLAEDLYNRLAAFTGHLSTLGNQLKGSVQAYNRSVGSLERSVLPGARRFRDLGIQPRRAIDELQPVESAPRSPVPPDDEQPGPEA